MAQHPPEPDPEMPVDPDDELTLRKLVEGFTRYVLPTLIAAFGIALIALGHGSYSKLVNTHSLESATGVAMLLVALTVWMLNWMYRLGVSSTQDRMEEERAREHFERTGRWPEDEPR